MKLGFTGTRNGMTIHQYRMAEYYIQRASEIHHGCCNGADIEADTLARDHGVYVHMHPPKETRHTPGFATEDLDASTVHPPKTYLKRNHDIVDACDVLLATPAEHREVTRSGTWATIRYARKQGKPIKRIPPTGFIRHENSPGEHRKRGVVVRVSGPKSSPLVINVAILNPTSKSKTWTRELSPFFLGPVDLYQGFISQNMENAWQHSKLYKQHTDDEGDPTKEYWKWAKTGWSDRWAHRYPMGRGAVPLCSLWDGEQLGYIEARKRIYVPLYAQAVTETDAYKRLRDKLRREKCVVLWDFDGYDHTGFDMTLHDVINDPSRKMGHAFVLAMLLEGHLTDGKKSQILR